MIPSHEPPPQHKNCSSAIRHQWRLFEKWLACSKLTTEKRRAEICSALDEEMLRSKHDTPPKFHAILQQEFEDKKTVLRREGERDMVFFAREEWQKRLATAGLNPEDWIDMTPSEKLAVEKALGDVDGDEPSSSSSSQPSGVSAPHAPTSLPNGRVQHTRIASQSTLASQPTQYGFVNPSTFREKPTREAGFSMDTLLQSHHWATDERTDRRPSAVPAQGTSRGHSHFRDNGAEIQSPEELHDDAPRSRVTTRYISPVLHDAKDTKIEEEDFERFKMDVRVKKIWEFHFEAATAGTQLTEQLRDRSLDKQKVKVLLAEHESNMERLQRIKEDERRSIVDSEREKRRSELRRRGAVHDATANPWKQFEVVIGNGHDRNAEIASGVRSGEQPLSWDTVASTQVSSNKATAWAQMQSQTTGTVVPKHDAPIASSSRQPATDPIWVPVSHFNSSHRDDDKRSPERKPPVTPAKIPDSALGQLSPGDEVRPATQALPRKRGKTIQDSNPSSSKTPEVPVNSKARRKTLLPGSPGDRKPEWPEDGLPPNNRVSPPHSTPSVLLSPGPTRTLSQRAEEFWIPDNLVGNPGVQVNSVELQQPAGPSVKPVPSIPSSLDAVTESASNSRSAWQQIGRSTEKRGRHTRSVSNAVPPSQAPQAAMETVVEEEAHVESSKETSSAAMGRLRRLSEPPPPSPIHFKPSAVQKQKSDSAVDPQKQPKSILKKTDDSQANRRPAAEEVPTAQQKKADKKRQKQAGKKAAELALPKSQRRVTIEEVSDEEADPLVNIGQVEKENKPPAKIDAHRPTESAAIVEPKPSPPSSSFTRIFHYVGEEAPEAPTVPVPETFTPVAPSSQINSHPEIWYPTEDPSVDQEEEFDWSMLFHQPEEKPPNKAKHVRWTPSVLARSGSPESSTADPWQTLAGIGWNPFPESGPRASSSVQKGRPRSGGFGRSGAPDGEFGNVTGVNRVMEGPRDGVRDLKGKGRAVREDPVEAMEEELGWAIENLKAMRSKAASAV